jgi:hypothetical protein
VSGGWRGCPARGWLDEELKRLAPGERPAPEALSAEIAALPVRIRGRGGEGAAATPWRAPRGSDHGARGEGGRARPILSPRAAERGARLGAQAAPGGVAVLGDIEALRPRLRLEAWRQSIEQAPRGYG